MSRRRVTKAQAGARDRKYAMLLGDNPPSKAQAQALAVYGKPAETAWQREDAPRK
jgi:hypothetical protein